MGPFLSVNVGELPSGFNVASTKYACLEPSTCYDFVINDLGGDGLISGEDHPDHPSPGDGTQNVGFYSLILDGEVIGVGKSFGSEESVNFCLDEEGTFNDTVKCADNEEKIVLTLR